MTLLSIIYCCVTVQKYRAANHEAERRVAVESKTQQAASHICIVSILRVNHLRIVNDAASAVFVSPHKHTYERLPLTSTHNSWLNTQTGEWRLGRRICAVVIMSADNTLGNAHKRFRLSTVAPPLCMISMHGQLGGSRAWR